MWIIRKLAKQCRRTKTPEALLQWQQQWEQALADAEVLEYCLGEHQWICQQQHQERMQQNRKVKLQRKQQRDVELELVQRERVQPQLREAMAECLEQIPEVAVEHDGLMASVSSPVSILCLVFGYLLLVSEPTCTWSKLLAHLHYLWRVAAVNCKWQAVALLLLY
ncbi:hypothetical protein IWW37_005653 [Coemansia sp. RSA 2050]|nr:hypothetical protein IWW37_005653 [Coemansia sp. RSA 2050]